MHPRTHRSKMNAIRYLVQYQPIDAFNLEPAFFDRPPKNCEITDDLRFFSVDQYRNFSMRYAKDGFKWHSSGTQHTKIRRINNAVKAVLVCRHRYSTPDFVGMAAGKKEHM